MFFLAQGLTNSCIGEGSRNVTSWVAYQILDILLQLIEAILKLVDDLCHAQTGKGTSAVYMQTKNCKSMQRLG
jgi:hypothetical protein